MKYRPEFPGRFGCLEDGLGFCRSFFPWYNSEHRHHGIALLTPLQVHSGQANVVLSQRQAALDAAYAAHPERFGRPPRVPQLRGEVWINPPTESPLETEEGGAPGLTQSAERVAPEDAAVRPPLETALAS